MSLRAGIESAVVEWRYIFYSLSSLTFGLSIRGALTWATWRRLLFYFGLGLALFLFLTLTLFDFWSIDAQRTSNFGTATFLGSRPLYSDAALLLVFACVIAMSAKMRLPLQIGAVLILGIATVFTQVRTAWVCLLFAAAYLLVQGIRRKQKREALPAFLGLVVVLLCLLLGHTLERFFPGSGMCRSGSEVIECQKSTDTTSTTSIGSTQWRIDLWTNIAGGMVERPTQLWTASLLGRDATQDDPEPAQFSPHNQYLTLLVQVGLLGLVALGVLWLRAWRDRSAVLRQDHVLLLVLLLYGIWFSWPYFTYAVLGVAQQQTGPSSGISLNAPTELHR